MFPGLTKDEIAKLSDEQREAIARIVLDQSRIRSELEKKASGYFGFYLIPLVLLIAMIATGTSQSGAHLPFVMLFLFGLIQFHAVGTKKRIDAMVKLMDLRLEEQAGSREVSPRAVHEEQS
jgi:hypothetical protein